MKIYNKYGNVLFESNNASVKETIEECVKKDADLSGANLRGADLSGANLSGANLHGANLHGADLRDANLHGADLSDADLYGADLSGADLRDANLYVAGLSGANLYGANLHGADLHGADLSGANLRRADLRDADLRGANLRDANLHCADLSGANLYGADLRGADLSGANLRDAKDVPDFPLSCPSHGSFIGWKKVGSCIVELIIPAEARRSSATSNKCRCDKAVVVSIYNLEDETNQDEVLNSNYAETLYKVGCEVIPDSFDENRWNECSHGIHFFINKEEAINY